MREQLEKIRNILTSCNLIGEAQESATQFEQDQEDDKTFKKETDKSFKADRLNLEDILNSTGRKKRDYVRKIIKTINKMVDGKDDVDTLINVVKRGKK